MGWLTSLFGGANTAEKAVDLIGDSVRGIGNWIDEKEYTQEEKAIAAQKAVDAHLELVKATANENSVRSVNRRWLAWGICGFVLMWGSVAMLFVVFGRAEVSTEIINVMKSLWMGEAFIAVITFFFGVQLLRK